MNEIVVLPRPGVVMMEPDARGQYQIDLETIRDGWNDALEAMRGASHAVAARRLLKRYSHAAYHVGAALARIKRQQQWQEDGHESWSAFCATVLQKSRQQCDELVQFAEVSDSIPQDGFDLSCGKLTFRQVKVLGKMTVEKRQKVVKVAATRGTTAPGDLKRIGQQIDEEPEAIEAEIEETEQAAETDGAGVVVGENDTVEEKGSRKRSEESGWLQQVRRNGSILFDKWQQTADFAMRAREELTQEQRDWLAANPGNWPKTAK